jgi:hypothetical protein
MQLGDHENFLRIDANESPDPYDQLIKVEAVASFSSYRFTAVHDALIITDRSEGIKQRFTDFRELKTAEFELQLSEGGWVKFKRHLTGYVTVHYRIAATRGFINASMDGETTVDGEFVNELYSLIGSLLKDKF